jgi:hypothetical protein
VTGQIDTVIRKSKAPILRLALLGIFTVAATLLAAGGTTGHDSEQAPADSAHFGHDHHSPAKLVQVVRDATRQFIDVNAAVAAGYGQFLGCISGPDQGAMGIHYVNGTLVGDGEVDASRPEALIYEPSNGRLRLVGVEFVVDAAAWMAHHTGPPELEGQTFLFIDSPNRFGSPPFFELHVWAWRDSPNGAFVDWNTRVTCEGL